VVTGANKGIGYHIAEQLRDSGHFGSIVLGCRSEALGREAAQKLGPPCEFVVPLDLSDAASIASFAAALEKTMSKLDGLVNNAGIAFKGSDPAPFAAQTAPTLAVNYWGTVALTEALLPLLRQPTAEDPFVVTVASMAGALRQIQSADLRAQFSAADLDRPTLDGLVRKFETDVASGNHASEGWGNSNYGFSKLAMIAYTKLLAAEETKRHTSGGEGAPHKVLVNCCCPGYCDTDMTSHKGSRAAADGARNAVMLALQRNTEGGGAGRGGLLLHGEFLRDYEVAQW
jgi:carbonyl reductase 1